MRTITVGLVGLSALDKVAKALFIEQKITGNAAFSGAAALLTTARENLEKAIANTLDGGKAATFAKNEAENEVDEVITQLAGFVVSMAGDDEALILSAGFEVRSQPKRIGDLPAPANMRAELTDKSGEIKVDWDVVHGTHEYEGERNDADPEDATKWTLAVITTRSKYVDTGLTSGSIHWYRVRARGTVGHGHRSDPARTMTR